MEESHSSRSSQSPALVPVVVIDSNQCNEQRTSEDQSSRDPQDCDQQTSQTVQDDDGYESLSEEQPVQPTSSTSASLPFTADDGTYLTTKDFNYSMDLLNKKINAIYQLCRFVGEQQERDSRSLRKLVALDELSESFWNVSY